MQTPTKEQGAPQNPGKPTPKRRKRGNSRRTPDQPKPRQFSSPGASLGLRCSLGGDISAFGSCPPPGCAAHPFRMAAVLDGVPEDGVVPHHHAAPFAMSSMRLSAAASGFRRISSHIALETWPVWVVWLNLNLGTFWSTMETSRNGAEGSTGGSTPAAPSPSGCRGPPAARPTPAARWPCRPGSGGGGCPSPGTPVPLTILAHVACPGLPFCLRDEFPRGDGAQDQATLHVRPEDMLHLHRIVLLPVVLTHHAVDVVRRDGGVNDPGTQGRRGPGPSA